jgi:putative ABC transport system permease protein
MGPDFMLLRLFYTIRLGIQTVGLHRLRSLLTVLGVVFGVASVIIMLAVGEGARVKAIAAINELGASNIILTSVQSSSKTRDGAGGGAIRYGLTDRDLRGIRAMLPSGAKVTISREHQRPARRLGKMVQARVMGVTPSFAELKDLTVDEGRFISDIDNDRGLAVAVLSFGVASELFPLSDPVGKTIRIGMDQYYHVIGVLSPPIQPQGDDPASLSKDLEKDILIPFSADRARFGENINFDPTGLRPPEKVEIGRLTVSLAETDQVRPTAQLVRSILMQNGRDQEVTFLVPLDLQAKAEQTQRVFTIVLTSIASISLLVGGIGIMNIMLATVTERTREIGIRRALGARRSDIVFQFLIETIVLAGTGGVIGMLLGFLGANWAESIGGVETIIQPWSPILAVTISLLVGIVFGIYPARRAAMMDPIQALRHE